MNKYFYPIYKMKLKPWIKYWLLKKGLNPIVLSELIEGTSPITIEKAYEGTTLQELTFKGQTIQNRVVKEDNYININEESYIVDLGGKNLLNPFVNHNAGYSTTIRGVTFTINQDGTITANGTATGGSATLILYGSWSGTTVYQTLDKTKNYCLPLLGNKQIIFVRTYDNGTFTTYNSNTQRTILNKENIVYFGVEISNGETVENYVFKPQLEEGITPTEYSPYTANPIELTEQDKLWNDGGVWKLNNTEITNTNLIEQLETIKNATLISGTNEITQTPADLPFILNFKYYMKG